MGNYQNWAEEHLLLLRCLNKSIFLARQGLCLWNQSYKKVCIINLSRNIEIKVFNERNLFSVWFRTCPNCLSVLNSDFDSMKTFTIASEFLIGLFETVVQNVWEDCSCCSCFVHKGWMFCSLDLDTEIQSPLHHYTINDCITLFSVSAQNTIISILPSILQNQQHCNCAQIWPHYPAREKGVEHNWCWKFDWHA